MSLIKHYPTILSIAGSDSIGGAGIQADIKTASALGVYAMTAITAVTAQNTSGVSMIQKISPDVLKGQLEAIVSDINPDAVKIGMIPDRDSALVISEFLNGHKFKAVVVDPVMVATSGDSLSEKGSLEILEQGILPYASVVTPNIPECETLSGKILRSSDDFPSAAEKIMAETGCGSVLVKGGHNAENGVMTDYFLMKNGNKRMEMIFPHPEVRTKNTHGTGCTLSSAISSYLALGYDLLSSVRYGIDFIQTALSEGADYEIGNGHGAVNHLFRIQNLSKQ